MFLDFETVVKLVSSLSYHILAPLAMLLEQTGVKHLLSLSFRIFIGFYLYFKSVACSPTAKNAAAAAPTEPTPEEEAEQARLRDKDPSKEPFTHGTLKNSPRL